MKFIALARGKTRAPGFFRRRTCCCLQKPDHKQHIVCGGGMIFVEEIWFTVQIYPDLLPEHDWEEIKTMPCHISKKFRQLSSVNAVSKFKAYRRKLGKSIKEYSFMWGKNNSWCSFAHSAARTYSSNNLTKIHEDSFWEATLRSLSDTSCSDLVVLVGDLFVVGSSLNMQRTCFRATACMFQAVPPVHPF